MTRKSNYNHPLFQERAGERLKITLASYYRYWGDEVAEMLEEYSEIDQRRIVHFFMDIIKMGRWKEENGKAVITCGVSHEIQKAMLVLINLYLLDIQATNCIKNAKEFIKP